MRTSFHHQPEAQHPKFLAIHKNAGRLPHLLGAKRTSNRFQIGPQLETATLPQYSKRNSRRQAHAIAGRSRDRLIVAHRLRRFIDRIHGEVI
jgi:hypothetical protein